MERLIKEIRRRTKVVGAFSDEESCLLLVTARAKAQEQAWSQRRYLNMDLLKELDLEAAKEELAIRLTPKRGAVGKLHTILDTTRACCRRKNSLQVLH